MCNLFIIFIFIFIIPLCNYICRFFRKFKTQSFQQAMVEIGWFQVESVLQETLNCMETSLLGLFLSNSFIASYSVFKVTLLCFLSTIHKQSSKQTNLKRAKRLKNIRIRKFEHIFSIPFIRGKKGTFFKIKIRIT